MSGAVDADLVLQRRQLRARLHAQRRLIEERLGPAAPAPRSGFPRSNTLRFVMRHPVLVRRVVLAAASGLFAVASARNRHAAAAALLWNVGRRSERRKGTPFRAP